MMRDWNFRPILKSRNGDLLTTPRSRQDTQRCENTVYRLHYWAIFTRIFNFSATDYSSGHTTSTQHCRSTFQHLSNKTQYDRSTFRHLSNVVVSWKNSMRRMTSTFRASTQGFYKALTSYHNILDQNPAVQNQQSIEIFPRNFL